MVKKNPTKTEKKGSETESGSMDMMISMQRQMMYIGPLMTLIIGVGFPSGMVLYWFVISLSLIVQQWYMQKHKNNLAIAAKNL